MDNENQHELIVKRIKELSFFIKEEEIDRSKEVKYSLTQKMGFNSEKEFLNLILIISYSQDEVIVAQIEVQNMFQVKNLKKYVDENNQLLLAPEILLRVLSESISHTRALLALNLTGTHLGLILVPVADTLTIAKGLFPTTFREDLNIAIMEAPTTKRKEAFSKRKTKKNI